MSEAIAFDTHGFVKNPTQNGFTTEKAVALIQRDIAEVEAALLKWMNVALIAQSRLVVGLVVSFVR